jgi:hypothetical protein
MARRLGAPHSELRLALRQALGVTAWQRLRSSGWASSTRARLHCAPGGNRQCMADGDIHVVKNGDDWTVTIEGIKGELVSFDTEDDAVRTARRVAEAAHSELIVHDGVAPADGMAAHPTSGRVVATVRR